MIFRKATQEEITPIMREGYTVWHKNRTFEQYFADNHKEDGYGTRYVVEEDGEIVSSLILLKLQSIMGRAVYGIGSVLTPECHQHKGYASQLLKNCVGQIDGDAVTFLYSEVDPAFYARYGFRVLPDTLQKDADSICMVLCKDGFLEELIKGGIEIIPDHF